MLGSVADGLLNPCAFDKGGYPSANDIIGAYGGPLLARALAGHGGGCGQARVPGHSWGPDKHRHPVWNSVTQALGSIPPPPLDYLQLGGSDLWGLWDTIELRGWLGDVTKAVVED